jgi:hypothetical protein
MSVHLKRILKKGSMGRVTIATILILMLAGPGTVGGSHAEEVASPEDKIPHAVKIARTTMIPDCTTFVDMTVAPGGDGSAGKPHKTIAAAIEAVQSGAVICVAEGTYSEQLKPGEKFFTLAGGFKKGTEFKVRDSATYVSKAVGRGGSFLRIEDLGPVKGLTAVDGFEITGYSQGIVREFYESQRFDVTNNFIHDNVCAGPSLAGAGVSLNNVSGVIKGNVFVNNSCARGGALFLNDGKNENTVSIESNRVDGNSGTEPGSAHGGALYLFGNTLNVAGNLITNNSVTMWGGGLYIGAYTQGNQPTTATLSRNVYRGNRAGDSGGGFFCDEGATCIASYEVYDRNCGGNVLVDGGAGGSGPTTTRFDHITNVGALEPDCKSPGTGFFADTYEALAPDSHSISNAIFSGNAAGRDLVAMCGSGCKQLKVGIDHSMVESKYGDGSVKIVFGPGIVAPADPLFVDAGKGDFRLQPMSPVLGKGTKGSDLGAYGTGGEAPPLAAATLAASAPAAIAASEAAAPKADLEQPSAAPAASAVEQSPAPEASDVSTKQAFDDAKELGTVEAWRAFIANYPSGFHSDLARAYLKKLGGVGALLPPASAPAPSAAPAAKVSAPISAGPAKPAVARGGDYMGFPEKFNRYYTDSSWKPAQTVYVSPDGGGDGASRDTPMAVADAVSGARPGTFIYFVRGSYKGGIEFSKETSGTYEAPIVLYAERNPDQSIGVSMTCSVGTRKTCLNFEAADYIAVDGFELVGGTYGVRAIGAGYAASEHSRGIAILNSSGHDQDKDPFFTGQADWAVFERNVGYGAKKGDGHGIYISNGGDWNIVRFNETFSNMSSDFQINADPTSTCQEVGIPFNDPRCDAYAGEGEGGQGASDYFLVDGNYFHHDLANGPNFTSVRRSIVRNNVFGPQVRHNVSFWQETDNPKLGSSDNKILHNLFITTAKHGVKFEASSTRNEFANNVILGVQVNGATVTANPKALLMEVDDTVGDNVYTANLYISGHLEGRVPGDNETAREDFSAGWFMNFPAAPNHEPNDFVPTADAPFLAAGALSADASSDRNGTARSDPVDLGPIEVR